MDYYNKISRGYNELHGEEQLKKLSIIKRDIKISNGMSILDVGCGTGISSGFDCNVIGIDPSIGLLRQNKGTKLLGLAEYLPFRDNSFDFVISVTAVHNFKDIAKSIGEMKRVGKKGFVFSILKRSKKSGMIMELILKNFKVLKITEEENDTILFCEKE
ncbi:methyltransferase domain-containing protein [Candidatus Woesearchaeota archaeon]|nr:methyltransferase domain-containing protein [Candidatus Woesearchaeota archaeon]